MNAFVAIMLTALCVGCILASAMAGVQAWLSHSWSWAGFSFAAALAAYLILKALHRATEL